MTANILRLILLRLVALWCGFCAGVGADMLRVYVLPDENLGTNYQLSQLRPDVMNWWQEPPHVMRVSVMPPSSAEVWQRRDCRSNLFVLGVELEADGHIALNQMALGTVSDTQPLRAKLNEIFQGRLVAKIYRPEFEVLGKNGVYSRREGKEKVPLTEFDKVERTIFLQADRRLSYDVVARVIDDLKSAGAKPVVLILPGYDSPGYVIRPESVILCNLKPRPLEVGKSLRHKRRAR